MASIVKRKKKFSVVYSYTDEKGIEHKKWETFDSNAEAKQRKAEVEAEKRNGTFTAPYDEDGTRTAGGLHVDLRGEHLGHVHI